MNNNSSNQRLSSMRLRDTQKVAEQSAAYSRTVSRLRWALPTLALIAVLILIIWPYWQAHKISVTMVENVPNLMIENLNMTGLDSKNQPYEVTATRALQAQNNKNIINLEDPVGEITLSDGATLKGKARKGRIEEAEKKLWLQEDVILTHDKGYRFTSEEAHIDIEKNEAWGNKPVKMTGDFGEVAGVGFAVRNSGETIIVNGPAKAQIRLDQDLQGTPKTDKK